MENGKPSYCIVYFLFSVKSIIYGIYTDPQELHSPAELNIQASSAPVCPVDRQQQRCAAGLVLSAVRAPRTSCQSISAAGARSAANAGSVMFRSEERGSTQTC